MKGTRNISSTAVAAFASGLLASVVLAPGAWAAPQPDQSSTGVATRAWGVYSSQWQGQTFTPSVSDVLSQISVKLYFWNSSGPITMNVYDTSGGLPTGAPLASQAVTGIPNGSAAADCANIDPSMVTFASPATLLAGHLYAFTLQTSQSGYDAAACSNPRTYAGGAGITAAPAPDWLPFGDYQLLFTTYMGAVAPTSDPSTPPKWTVVHQALPVPASGRCADLQDADVSYGTGLHGGWQLGWEPWVPSVNPGVRGGWACIRVLINTGGHSWQIDNAYA